MKVGDLVRFHNCEVAGTTGVIVEAPEPTVFVDRPHLHTYFVTVNAWKGQVQCFTGSQLEVING
jgi:hypothetical protein